jgi:hypothetical protein
MNEEERLVDAIGKTKILRMPRQSLATFGVTTINYYLLSYPAYADENEAETVVRMGHVIANRPRIVTPYYLSRLHGFSEDAKRYFEKLIEIHGADAPGIYYTYRNEPGSTDIISNGIDDVLAKINKEIDDKKDALAAIIFGEDTLWDVSLMKFIFDVTSSSVNSNIADFHSHGLLDIKAGVPSEALAGIEEMFVLLKNGVINPRDLQLELERWGLFDEYQDRFLAAIRR